MKKGFTLIELLAVIVILAIIALIATPIVLSIIEETKESAVLRSAEYYLSAVENSIAKKSLSIGGSFSPNTCVVQINGDLLCDGKDELKIEVSGEKPSSGTITFDKGKITSVELTQSNKTITKNEKGQLVLGEATEEIKLAPGLYDENDNLLISWEDLTSTEYKTITYVGYDDDWNEIELTSAILNVDENGELTSAYEGNDDVNYSAEYLVGKLIIDDSVTSMYATFVYCDGLTEVVIPNSVTKLEWGVFKDCTSLTSITIPASVTDIGNQVIEGCSSLTSIVVDKNNGVYDSRNNSNAIIETSTNTLIAGCKNTVIPSSVTSIGFDAFYNCDSLTTITIPEGVTSIGYNAFENCSGLTSITISSSVTSIGNSAFLGCSGLTTINYTGTQTQWNAISKASSWDNNTPSNKVINYNYTG